MSSKPISFKRDDGYREHKSTGKYGDIGEQSIREALFGPDEFTNIGKSGIVSLEMTNSL